MAAIVGSSDGRTDGKHFLHKWVLGKQCAVIPALAKRGHGPLTKYPFTVVELTAGDGRDTRESGTCSPRITADALLRLVNGCRVHLKPNLLGKTNLDDYPGMQLPQEEPVLRLANRPV